MRRIFSFFVSILRTARRALSLEQHFLPLLFCALVLPSVAVLMLSVISMVSLERAMEAAVSSYVVDLAESIAYHPVQETKQWRTPSQSGLFPGWPFSEPISRSSWTRPARFPFMPSIPGWVAHITSSGKVLMSSPGVKNIAAIWRPDLPIGKATRVTDRQGAQYTLAIYPMSDGEGFVVAAVSWDQLLGGIVSVSRMWPALTVLMAFGSFFAIRMLWRRLVRPLKTMVAEIDTLRVGRDTPDESKPGEIKEIKSLNAALMRFSRAAIERDTLRNSYVRDIVQAQEKERMDMAREIHDGPLQDITALLQQIHMSLLDEEIESRQTRIKRTEVLAKGVVRELRGLCDELSPPWMDLGLEETLTELAERLSQTYDIDVSLDVDLTLNTSKDTNTLGQREDHEGREDAEGQASAVMNYESDSASDELEVSREVIVSFMRIFQEAVSNAVRHGGATEVRAQVRVQNSELVLEISDNGQGFDATVGHETLRLQGHRGLANMTERMSLMGGRLEVLSEIDKGTRVIASLPVSNQGEKNNGQ